MQVRVIHKEQSKFEARASLICTRCGVATATTVHPVQLPLSEDISKLVELAGSCQNPSCGGALLIELDVTAAEWRTLAVNDRSYSATIHPAQQPRYDEPDVPDEIRRAYVECLGCLAAGYVQAAALVGRRALERMVKDQGAPEGSLRAQIDALDPDLVPAKYKQAAHQVRLIGNEAAHDEAVSTADANELAAFVKVLLDIVYVQPARVAAALRMRPQR